MFSSLISLRNEDGSGYTALFAYFLCSSYIIYYCWFLSGNFSFTLILALPPNAFFSWLKPSTIICGFPEREPPWSGGGGRRHSKPGVSGRYSKQSTDSGVSWILGGGGGGRELATNFSLT